MATPLRAPRDSPPARHPRAAVTPAHRPARRVAKLRHARQGGLRGLSELFPPGTRESARYPASATAVARRDGDGSRATTAGRRPSQQRADGRTRAPRQLLCREAAVPPCAPVPPTRASRGRLEYRDARKHANRSAWIGTGAAASTALAVMRCCGRFARIDLSRPVDRAEVMPGSSPLDRLLCYLSAASDAPVAAGTTALCSACASSAASTPMSPATLRESRALCGRGRRRPHRAWPRPA